MKILLVTDEGRTETATVVDKGRNENGENWVRASIDAAWWFLNYTCSDHVTAYDGVEPEAPRIATVSLVIHDE